ncbi:MAG TPA: succinate dehydrogenase, cytochrome b556 subunit [Pseudomonadales bacterium]
MNKKRPVNLDLTTIKLPLPGITSILHRISGFALFLAIPLLLLMFQQSMASEEAFNELKTLLDNALLKLILWAILAGILYHLIAGIKHLIMDAGFGETLEGARVGSWAVLFISGLLVLVAGVWLW